jgi:O-antigen/teichoic acid export membrane protein
MFLPFAQGLLQGAQNFAWLGWSIMLNGLGRVVGVAVAVLLFGGQATGALAGALFGLLSAVFVGLWPSRGLFTRTGASFDASAWLKRVLPLTAGVGSVLFIMNADMIFVQRHFPKEVSAYYGAVVMVGVGLVTFTTPMAVVMFPKVVSGLARAQRTDSFQLALVGTAVLGVSGALICTIFPSLPLRIIYFNNEKFWISAQLVPWFMWGMLPVTLANVLIADLLAKRRFTVSIWLLVIAIGYAFSIEHYLHGVPKEDYFAAFKGVVQRLGMFSCLLLAVSGFLSWRTRRHAGQSAGVKVNP